MLFRSEEWGRGYIGSRTCECDPTLDIKYLGSFRDKTFKPTQKVILGEYETREDALRAEVSLHSFFSVDENSHFANRAKQTSEKFIFFDYGNTHSRGRVQSKEERELRSRVRTGKRHSPETKQKIKTSLEGRNTRQGKPPTRGTTGMKLAQEWKDKISKGCTGQKRTPEQRERYKQAALKREAKKRNSNSN